MPKPANEKLHLLQHLNTELENLAFNLLKANAGVRCVCVGDTLYKWAVTHTYTHTHKSI